MWYDSFSCNTIVVLDAAFDARKFAPNAANFLPYPHNSLNKLLNKQSIVELLVIWEAMPLTYRQCNERGPGIFVDTLNPEDRASVDLVQGYAIFKPNELYYISWLTPQFNFILAHMGLFSFHLDRVYQLATRTVKYERYRQHHYSGTQLSIRASEINGNSTVVNVKEILKLWITSYV